jgi:hypothetical protein
MVIHNNLRAAKLVARDAVAMSAYYRSTDGTVMVYVKQKYGETVMRVSSMYERTVAQCGFYR